MYDPIAKKMPDVYVLEEDSTALEEDAPRILTDKATTGKEPPAKLGRDERKSCRCKVPPARQSCELKVGSNVWAASLVNESKRGFAVLTDHLNGLEAGEKVELHTDKGWFTFRIIYIKEVSTPQDAAPECDSWFRLGLKKTGGLFSF
jgi:hypothetical protein